VHGLEVKVLRRLHQISKQDVVYLLAKVKLGNITVVIVFSDKSVIIDSLLGSWKVNNHWIVLVCAHSAFNLVLIFCNIGFL
jgi:hypothetical protein